MKLSINILTNFFARLWVAGIGVILVPQYIHFLGIESYGLVGFYGTLIGSMSILDLGLSTSLNRELTKARVNNQGSGETRDLVFTLEMIYFSIGFIIAAAIILLAPLIASYWIKTDHIPVPDIRNAIMLMGIVIAFQWPVSLYNGGLTGMNKLIVDNIIMVVMTTLRSAGVILILWFVSPTINAFFLWQALISFIYVLTMRAGLWHYLPKSLIRPKFSKLQIQRIWRFAAGMTSIGIVTFMLMQIDKIILSKMLSLTQYGYYMLSFTVANSISMFVGPVNIAVFPKLTALVTTNDQTGLIKTYHRTCKLLASIVFPVGLILIFFTGDILLLWTKDPVVVTNTFLMVKILIAGSVINSLMVGPYLLLLAHGQTRFTFYQNLISSILMVPLLFLWVHLYGALGGTFVWLSVNIGCLLIGIPLVHKKLLKNELKTWYINDTLLPLLPPLAICIITKIILFYYGNQFKLNVVLLFLISTVALISSLIFLPEARAFIKQLKNILNKNEKPSLG